MDAFREEVRGYSVEDLDLIIEDQEDLYTAEEFAILKQERENRRTEEERRRAEEERQRREREAARKREMFMNRVANLKANGYDGYYEYRSLSLTDDNAGGIYTDTIDNRLNDLALDGWRLVSSYTNELGRNTTPGTAYSAGSNSTIDQHILIFERFVKI
jgi:hypothetical protein